LKATLIYYGDSVLQRSQLIFQVDCLNLNSDGPIVIHQNTSLARGCLAIQESGEALLGRRWAASQPETVCVQNVAAGRN
jgi:hypothetical protein